jgi:magnesium chelatase family protein
MDRIDIHLQVQRVPFQKLAELESGEPYAVICQRVAEARLLQEERFAQLNKPHILVNGDMGWPKCRPIANSTNLVAT